MKIKISVPEPIKKILQILHDAGGKPRLVGGSVRDALLNIETSDIDIITPFAPDIVTQLLTQHGIFVKNTGIKYGTVTAFAGGEHAQITTLRVDKDCDGRHVNAEFTDDFELDATRRDFTINAMSYCPFEEMLYDYMKGYDDLIAGRVIFIGDPTKRIEEDYLRILRFFRFSDKFAKTIDAVSLQCCITLKDGMKRLSHERVLMEMNKIMQSPTSHKVLSIMIENDILKDVMPVQLTVDLLTAINSEINAKKNENDAPSSLQTSSIVKFAALMHKNKSSMLKDALYEMKFSGKEIHNITSLVKFREENPNIYELPLSQMKNVFFALWVEQKHIDSYMLISECRKSKHFEDLNRILKSAPPKFPVNGHDLESTNLKGTEIKIELQKLKDKWIASEFSLTREMLLDDIKG